MLIFPCYHSTFRQTVVSDSCIYCLSLLPLTRILVDAPSTCLLVENLLAFNGYCCCRLISGDFTAPWLLGGDSYLSLSRSWWQQLFISNHPWGRKKMPLPFGLKLKRTRRYTVSSKSCLVARIQLLNSEFVEFTLSVESTGQESLEAVAQRLELREVSKLLSKGVIFFSGAR